MGSEHRQRHPTFYILLIGYSVLAGSVDCLTATTVQAIVPYGYTQQAAGFSLAIMIFIGLFSASINSPILDKIKRHTLGVKILSALIALLVTMLPFVVETGPVPGLLFIFALIGIAILPAQPAILETQADWTHPVSPEFSSFVYGSGAKVIAAMFTVVAGNVLMLDEEKDGKPKGSIPYAKSQLRLPICIGHSLNSLFRPDLRCCHVLGNRPMSAAPREMEGRPAGSVKDLIDRTSHVSLAGGFWRLSTWV